MYNAPDEVEACLDRVLRWTPRNVGVLVIDDASPDPAIAPLLDRYRTEPRVRILRNEQNLGFTGTVNRGMDWCRGDVVILNSDARVVPNWFQSLRAAAYSGDRVASASATSDNAGAFSLPEPGANPSPGIDEDALARLYDQRSPRRWLACPTAHGFCAYLRRAAIDEVGTFDIERFPRGYGEENDWSMRAGAAGWTHVIDDSTMVFHSNAASFSPDQKSELVDRARAVVDELHPTYTPAIRSVFSEHMPIVRTDARATHAAAEALAASGSTVRPRLLSVVHKGRGGTPQTNRDLMGALETDWDPWILTSDGTRLELSHVVAGVPELVETIDLDITLGANIASSPVYRSTVARIVMTMGFELVHVRHLFKHAQDDLADILRAVGVPSVLSFHDFYFVCPNIHLLDDQGNFCGGVCTPGAGECSAPATGTALPIPLKHDWVYDWRDAVRGRFDAFDQFVTTSPSAARILTDHFPALGDGRLTVIPHGRDLSAERRVATAPTPDRVRIVVIGNLSHAKGGSFLRELLACDTENRLDVHVLGEVETAYKDLRCTFHGRYQRKELPSLLAEIQPAFGALLSIWPETWSHTLSESWAMGLPVLVGHEGGALTDRVVEHGGGWVIDTGNAAGSYADICSIAADAERWQAGADGATIDHLTSTAQMGDRYREVYEKARSRRTGLSTVDVRVVTDRGKSPGSAHVRALRRFSHPEVVRQLDVSPPNITAPKAAPASVLWVERTAIEIEEVDELLADRDRWGAHLVVDLDDDLVNADQLPKKFADYAPTMVRLVGEADLVTVSTPPLLDVIRPLARDVELLPNQLDEGLWWGAGGPEHAPRRPEGDDLRILYMGTATHGDDIELLRNPIVSLRSAINRDVTLCVVGGAPPSDDEWFERIPVPNDAKEYPAFVAWLRSIGGDHDFAVAPLCDTRFSRSKSDLKFLEYAALGLPCAASDVAPYRSTIEHGTDGLLVANDDDAWLAALTELADRNRQDELRRHAIAHVQTRTISATAADFVTMLQRRT